MVFRGLNTREYRIVIRGMSDAQDLLERGYLPDAKAALREPKKILERHALNTRMLALLYELEGRVVYAQNKPDQAAAFWQRALHVLSQIDLHDPLIPELEGRIRYLHTR